MTKDRKRFILYDDGKLDNCLAYIRKLSIPEQGQRPYEVVIQKHYETLRDWQRGGFHYLCKLLSEETGYSLGEIKELVKQQVYGTKLVKIGSVEREVTESSEYDAEGKKRTTIDYSLLIEGAYQLGSEAGITLPTLDRFKRRAAMNTQTNSGRSYD